MKVTMEIVEKNELLRVDIWKAGGILLWLTTSQIFPYWQRTESTVSYIEIREHLQLDHLVSYIQEGFGIHGEGFHRTDATF